MNPRNRKRRQICETAIEAQPGRRVVEWRYAGREAQSAGVHVALHELMTGDQRSGCMAAAARGAEVDDGGCVSAIAGEPA